MKLNRLLWVILGVQLLAGVHEVRCQGTFRNLDFESATPPFVPILAGVYSSNAIPGWTPYFGEETPPFVYYNSVSLGGAAVSLHGPGSTIRPPQGLYAVLLQGSTVFQSSAAIAQVGVVPQDAQSLSFFLSHNWGLDLTFGSQPIPIVQIASRSNYVIVGADISAFAGQAGELRFTVPPNNGNLIDNIQFSTEPLVPEPSVFGLTALGCVFAAWRLLRRRRR
jgi:hypothetical protein